MNKHEEKEKLMNEVLGKSRRFTNVYNDSLDILSSTESELNKLLDDNKKSIDELSKSYNFSDNDLKTFQQEIESDFGIKNSTPENVVIGKASKNVFAEIENELKEVVIGQDEACHNISIAFRRPYVIGSDPQKIRNSIIVYGNNGTGRHLIVESMSNLLKKHGLTVSSEISYLDMSRYQTSSQEILFLQDLYVALNGNNSIIAIEKFNETNPIFNRMLAELVENGTCILNKRYTFIKNQLQEATNNLSCNIIDHLNGNNKTLVFISEVNPTKMMDDFGKTFIDTIQDKVETKLLDEESIEIIIAQLLESLDERCETQLEIEVNVDNSLKGYLKKIYEPSDGVDSLSPVIRKIYNKIVDIALQKENIKTLNIKYDNSIKALFNDDEYDLSINDDISKEREEIQKELDEIVGLNDVKNYLLSLENHIKISQLRKQKGLKTAEISKHMIFTGNPGTGKTTIARIVSRMMKVCGILKQGQLVEVTRADLVGKYVGHTAPLTMSVINSALGGVLFIDEAYSLYRGKDDSFGLEAIDTIVKAMEDHRDDLIVILAGYSKEMSDFLTANSGLKSRFANIIQFDDYTGEEMLLIAKSIAKSKDYEIDESAIKPLQEYFEIIQSKKDPNSGNGRLARNLVEAAILKQSKRIIDNPNDDLNILKIEDFDIN